MRIKEVCEKTGLTDKTVRYYIRSGLIFPKYNENYTGRKNFDFDEMDIERLNQVALLRKYDFSINDIKRIFDDNENIGNIVKNHIDDMREKAESSSRLLSKLNDVSACNFSNASDLCEMLCKTEYLPATVPSSDSRKPYKLLYSKNKKANRALIILIIAVITLSAVLFSMIFNNIRSITNSSIIDINNRFAGIRVIETDDKNCGVQYMNDLYVEDDYFLSVSDNFDEYYITVKNSHIGKDTITIHAVIHSDKSTVKVVPMYYSKYTDEIIYYNSSSWMGLNGSDGVTVKSITANKSKNYKYLYEIEIVHS